MRPSVLGEREITQRLVFLKAPFFFFLANKKSYQTLGTFAHSFLLNAVGGRLR